MIGMKKTLLLFLMTFGLFNFCDAQEDSLEVFRTPSKVNANANSAAGNTGKNALSLSIAHLGRGGTMLTYERLINNTAFSVYAGIGLMSHDILGQWSWLDGEYIYTNVEASRTSVDLGKSFDLGFKYLYDKELGGSYVGLAYSSYSNVINLSVDKYQLLVANESSAHKLNYNSREFKFVYGFINDAGSNFYNDFNFGLGFRMLNYQTLEITEVNGNSFSSNNSYYTQSTITAREKSQTEVKFKIFIGWKMGLRF